MIDVDFSELKKVLYEAAKEYLNHPDTQPSTSKYMLIRWMSSISHGDVGRNRAHNLRAATQPDIKIYDDDLFILLDAVFKSSSSLLKKSIANCIFVGEYKEFSVVGGECYKLGKIESSVLLPDLIEEIKTFSDIYDLTTSELSSSKRFLKVSALEKLLNFLVEKNICDGDTHVSFTKDVAERLRILESAPVSTTQNSLPDDFVRGAGQ
jgi:hypothetical protein